jgi:hypothetical protein
VLITQGYFDNIYFRRADPCGDVSIFEHCGVTPPTHSNLCSNGLRILTRFLLTLIVCALVSSALAQSQPNIIIILADDLGYGDVAFNGCPDYPTPNIDSLTTNGVRCSSGYVTHPFCSPSRAALLTGRYQQRFGHEYQPESDDNNPRLGLPMQELLLPQMLKSAGYACGAIGKWHLGSAPNFRPTQRGFDEFFGFLGGALNTSVLHCYETIRPSRKPHI